MKPQFIRQAVTRWIGADRESPLLKTPESAAEFFRSLIEDEAKEHFMVLLLSSRHRYLGYQIVSVGTLNQSLVHPREVFSVAIRECASAVLLAHNHPSGDARPSHEDHVITRRLIQAGEILGISVLDHIVLGADDFKSFAQLGLMSAPKADDDDADMVRR